MRNTQERTQEITLTQAAEMCRLSPSTVYRHIVEGKLPARQIGRFYILRRADVLMWNAWRLENVKPGIKLGTKLKRAKKSSK